MHELTLLFLAGLAASTGLRLWLAQRQIDHVKAHREQVPAEFRDRIDAAQHRKAADYTTARTRFSRMTLMFDAALLLVWTLGGGLDLLDRSLAQLQWGPIATGVAFLVAYTLLNTLIELPADIYRTFGIESRFGFNRSTPGLFISDQIKGLLLGAVLGIPLAAVVLWLLDSAGTLWWLYTWLVWMGFNLLLLWAYPTLIAPIFNKFTPLDDPALRQRIENLLQRCGFTSQGVFVADGSRRSSHGNAYFTGFGRNKRIVFFDTLLEALTPEQIEAVLAHELGHFKRKHVLKNILLMALLSLAGLAVLGWLMTHDWFYAALGLSRASDHAALVLFMILGSVFGVLLQPLLAQLSRRFEFEADAFAAAQCPTDDLIEALVRLYRDNASTLTPDPLHSAFHDSHPPAGIRIAHLRAAGSAGPAVG